MRFDVPPRIVLFAVAVMLFGLAGAAEASQCHEICGQFTPCDQPCWIAGGPPSTCGAEGYQCGCPNWQRTQLHYEDIELGQCPNPNKPAHFVKAAGEWHYRWTDLCGNLPSYRVCVFGEGYCRPPTTFVGPQWCPFCGYGQECQPY